MHHVAQDRFCCPVFVSNVHADSLPLKAPSDPQTEKRRSSSHHHCELSSSVMKRPWGCLFPDRRQPALPNSYYRSFVTAGKKDTWKYALRVGLYEWMQTAVWWRYLTLISGNWLWFNTGAAHAAGLIGTSVLPGVAEHGADRCSWLFIQTQRDGTGVKWQMRGVIIRVTCNAAVEHCGENYTAASCLNGWAGQRLLAWVAWNTTVKRYFNLNYRVFVGSVRNFSLAQQWSTCGGEKPSVDI